MKIHKINLTAGYSLTALILAMSLLSCENEDFGDATAGEKQSGKSLSSKNTVSFDPRALNLSEEEVYLYPEDPNYEMIDMGRYALAKVLKDLVNEQAFNQIIAYAKSNGIKTITFDKIFSLVPNLKNLINDGLMSQSLPGCPHDFSTFDNIQNVMSRNGIDYDLGLYLYNLDSNPGSSSFILTPGTELDDEEGTDDQVMAWYKESNTSSPVAIKISEDEAKTFASMGTFGTVVLSPKNPVVTGPGNGGTTPAPHPVIAKINIRNINIHYRYEKHGKSEVYMHGIYNTGGNNWTGIFNTGWPVHDNSKHLTSTKKTNEWVTVDHGQYLFQSNISAVWNTFERDWWEGFKPISNLNGATTIQQSGAPMTFADEWYALIPSTDNLSNNKSMGPLKSPIISNGSNNTYVQGEWNKFETNFYAQ